MRYHHDAKKDDIAHLADGTYCLAANNGNIVLHFYQEMPHIPEKITINHDENNDINNEHDELTRRPGTNLYGDVCRNFVGKVQLTPEATRQLIQHLEAALKSEE